MNTGPINSVYNVYEDFFNYRSGIYRYVSGKLLGGHSVRVIGWGYENGTDYWLVANSWGTAWGMKGFFKIKIGDKLSKFDENMYSCTPDTTAWI